MANGRSAQFISAMGKVTDDFRCHINTMAAWSQPETFAVSYIQDRGINGEIKDEADPEVDDLDDTAGSVVPDLDDAVGDGKAGEDDVENGDAKVESDVGEEDLEEKMKLMLYNTLGPPLDEVIKNIREIAPATHPASISFVPFEHQLAAASRLAHMARSHTRGGILANQMGFGKSRTSILAALEAGKKADEGPILIITKKSLVTAWKTEIKDMFVKGYQLQVIIPTSETTPSELYDFDVVIVNFESIMTQYASIQQFAKSFDGTASRLPLRPAPSILSDIHRWNDRRFRVIIDEAQYLKNLTSTTNIACQGVFRSYTLLLSGTVFDNHWLDAYGVIRMLSTPFPTVELFQKVFGTERKKKHVTPSDRKVKRLQKYLLGFTIARPLDTLPLKPIVEEDVRFELNNDELTKSDDLFNKYARAQRASGRQGRRVGGHPTALRFVTQAVQESTHPALKKISPNDDRSALWVDGIRERGTALDSSRMRAFKTQFEIACSRFPNERVVVTAEHVSVLDIVALILEDLQIQPIFYDGRVTASDRALRLKTFQSSHPGSAVLLITPSTGGTGLNIPQASIMFQLNVWWNRNLELQMYARLRRPSQPFTIKVYRMVATNAKVDGLVLMKQEMKTAHNEKLMEGLRWPDEGQVPIPLVVTPHTKVGNMFTGSWIE